MDINSAVGRKGGLTDVKIAAISSGDPSPFSETELLVLELADAMTDTPSNISDDLYARLRQQFTEVLLELSAHIAFENCRARANRVFDIKSDELYKPQTS